ncbi:aspartate transaminase [Halosimplex carlsbadense 2-9-1]|uniref:Aminotransferase n=1 Tax=Halosimplex carlsbadense 2-9-1 TaxID=797114 RepID=M0CC97_9EURY|nr:pyridoxal phosphate-dependent aminotransferase [Halosimplex carlsbadense]ELZ19972.1 aspartate transaminase [Halosimplex carlsbadense 2-9-1]
MTERADTGPDASRVSERVRAVEPQGIREMFDLAVEQDGDLVHLELGEPDFDTPDHVVEAACEAATAGRTNYTANAGIAELRAAVADALARDGGPRPDPESEVVVTTGGVEALHLAIHAVADPGDEVVVPTPAWPNPISQAKLADATPVEVPMPADDGFVPDPQRIVDAIGPDTAAVLLTSPSNPTGRMFPESAVERVVRAAADHGAYVLADEVYRELTYTERPPRTAAVADRLDRESWVLTVGSVSKAYAMTGWRVGWLAGPADVIGQVTKIREHTTSCVNTPAQHAALAALTGPQEPVEEMRQAFAERRAYVLDRIADIDGVSVAPPEGAFYAFVDVSGLAGSDTEIATRLLTDHGVVTAPGSAFGAGGAGHLRLSFSNGLDRLETGLDRFEAMVEDGAETQNRRRANSDDPRERDHS